MTSKEKRSIKAMEFVLDGLERDLVWLRKAKEHGYMACLDMNANLPVSGISYRSIRDKLVADQVERAELRILNLKLEIENAQG